MSGSNETKPSVSEALRQHSTAFTGADKKIVRALHDDYPRAGLESLPKLAARADVSGPTVLRLLAKIGYPTYGDFQAALHDEVTERMSAPDTRPVSSEEVDADDPVQTGLGSLAQSVTTTAGRIDRVEFEAAVELLCEIKRPVTTFGGFESEVCASHLATLLSQVRPGVQFQSRGATRTIFEVLDLKRQGVVVAFDFRRYQRSTMTAVELAAERGATVILFTDRWFSPAADFAKHVFVCESQGPGRFDSRVACLALLEVIVAAVTERLGAAGERRISAVYELLSGSTWGENLSDPEDEPPAGTSTETIHTHNTGATT